MIDHIKITVKAGNGGRGITSFHREKFVPKGGPDGGDGGRGGDIIIEASEDLTILRDLQYRKHIEANNGQPGGPREMKGADGEDVIIKVPTGSIIKINRIESEKIISKRRKGDYDNTVEYEQNILNYRRMEKLKFHELSKNQRAFDSDKSTQRENIGNNLEGEVDQEMIQFNDADNQLPEHEDGQTYPSDSTYGSCAASSGYVTQIASKKHKSYIFSSHHSNTDTTPRVQKNQIISRPTFDLVANGERITIAHGGKGGRGNARFKSASHQTPTESERGQKGDLVELEITLKMIAQVGLIGFPNVGKSTLLSKLTATQPKIGNYPFTTLEPNLGVLKDGGKTLVIADVPGLIEGAHEGKGLGVQFLQHIERTALIVHLIEIPQSAPTQSSSDLADSIYNSYSVIRQELSIYKAGLESKEEIVVINKIDLLPEEDKSAYVKAIEERFGKGSLTPLFISAGENIGVQGLKKILLSKF